MNEQLVHLRIKIKSLVDESRTIRSEANKTSGMAKWRLNHHRTTVVRDHSRHNLLAYGLLRYVPYSEIEKRCYKAPNFSLVEKHAKKFGGIDTDIETWVTAAKEHIKKQKKKYKLAS